MDDSLSVDAQAMFDSEQEPVDVSTWPVLAQKAFFERFNSHCGPLILLWLQMWVYEKAERVVARYSIEMSMLNQRDLLERAVAGVDDTLPPQNQH